VGRHISDNRTAYRRAEHWTEMAVNRIAYVVGAALAWASGGMAEAQERPFTPALACSAIRTIVATQRDVTLASSQTAYEMVHADSMACASDETAVPAFEPASDEPNCLAGWRCRQRSNGDNAK